MPALPTTTARAFSSFPVKRTATSSSIRIRRPRRVGAAHRAATLTRRTTDARELASAWTAIRSGQRQHWWGARLSPSFAAALPTRCEGSEIVACVGSGSGVCCFASGFASAWARTGFCSRRGAVPDTVFAGLALAAVAAGAGDAAVADAGAVLRGPAAVRSFSTKAALSSRTCLIICSSAGASRTTAGGITAGGCAGSCALPRREAATALAHPAPPISRILIMTFERCGKRPSIKHPLRLKRPVVFQTRV